MSGSEASMWEYLQTTVDKFTFRVARDRWYTREGVWLLPSSDGGTVRLGVSDYLQQHSGDVAFVNLKATATALAAEDEFAELETIKTNITLPSPLAGVIVETNQALEANPEFVNQDPYGNGWLVTMRPTDWEQARPGFLDANAYFECMRSEIEEELKESS